MMKISEPGVRAFLSVRCPNPHRVIVDPKPLDPQPRSSKTLIRLECAFDFFDFYRCHIGRDGTVNGESLSSDFVFR